MISAKIEKLVKILDGLDYDKQIEMWNRYADTYIYDMADFDEVLANTSPSYIARAVKYGQYYPAYNYFFLDDNNVIISCRCLGLDELYDLAEYIIDDDNDFGIDEITEILEK